MASADGPPPSAATGLGPSDDDYPKVLDPWNECPDKMIWLLYGWLAWSDNLITYETELRELQRMLVERLAMLEWSKKSQAKRDARTQSEC